MSHWGTRCIVCDFDFGDRYGALGQGFIHVHHLVELASVGHDYRVDPTKDLVPLCPNCHSMVHQQRPALTPEELRKIILSSSPDQAHSNTSARLAAGRKGRPNF